MLSYEQINNSPQTTNTSSAPIEIQPSLYINYEQEMEYKDKIYYICNNFNEFYTEKKILGEGCMGLVKLCLRKGDKKKFAVKSVRTRDEETIKNIKREFINLKKLNHPNIVKVYELFIDQYQGIIYSVMELIEGKEMFHIIDKLGSYDEHKAKILFKQVMEAIFYMHKNEICHRDIKPNNILCSLDGNKIKITDFNISKFSDQYKNYDNFGLNEDQKIEMFTYTGTISFSAPEIFIGGGYDYSVDIWSSGVLLYTMLSGKEPFESEYVDDVIKRITNIDYNFEDETWQNISDDAKDLIKQCLQKDPKQRITPFNVLQHKWFQQDNIKEHQQLQSTKLFLGLNLSHLVKTHEEIIMENDREQNINVNKYNIQNIKSFDYLQSTEALQEDIKNQNNLNFNQKYNQQSLFYKNQENNNNQLNYNQKSEMQIEQQNDESQQYIIQNNMQSSQNSQRQKKRYYSMCLPRKIKAEEFLFQKQIYNKIDKQMNSQDNFFQDQFDNFNQNSFMIDSCNQSKKQSMVSTSNNNNNIIGEDDLSPILEEYANGNESQGNNNNSSSNKQIINDQISLQSKNSPCRDISFENSINIQKSLQQIPDFKVKPLSPMNQKIKNYRKQSDVINDFQYRSSKNNLINYQSNIPSKVLNYQRNTLQQNQINNQEQNQLQNYNLTNNNNRFRNNEQNGQQEQQNNFIRNIRLQKQKSKTQIIQNSQQQGKIMQKQQEKNNQKIFDIQQQLQQGMQTNYNNNSNNYTNQLKNFDISTNSSNINSDSNVNNNQNQDCEGFFDNTEGSQNQQLNKQFNYQYDFNYNKLENLNDSQIQIINNKRNQENINNKVAQNNQYLSEFENQNQKKVKLH